MPRGREGGAAGARPAGMPIADDELALAAADWHHRVDGLQARLHGLRNGLTRDYAGGDFLDDVAQLGVDRALAVDRLSERVDHSPKQLRSDRHREDLASALHRVALGDVRVL